MLTDKKGQADSKTAEELKKEIEAATEKVEKEAIPDINQDDGRYSLTDKVNLRANEGNTAPEISEPDPQPQPEAESDEKDTPRNGQGDKNDPLEWAKKKGLRTPEDVANSLRNLEREFHKRNTQNKSQTPQQAPRSGYGGGGQPSEYGQAYSQNRGTAPYQPPASPSYYGGNDALLSQYAKRYDMHPDDFKKVLEVSDDIAQSRLLALRQEFQRELYEIKQSNVRNNDLLETTRQPGFRNPQVQKELHRVLEENPNLFEGDRPYSQAYSQALQNIAIKTIEAKGQDSTESENGTKLPKNPPSTGGGSSSQGRSGPTDSLEMTAEKFASLSVEDQRKYLQKMKLRPRGLFDK